MLRTRRGQSIMEYIIILTALVTTFLIVRAKLSGSVNRSYGDLSDKMETAITSIDTGIDSGD